MGVNASRIPWYSHVHVCLSSRQSSRSEIRSICLGMVWESATPVDGFSSVVDSLAEHAVERLLTSLRPTRLHAIDDDAEWEALQSGLAAAVRDLVSDAKAAAEHLWSEAEEEYAERLRRQEDTYKVKLERSRTAATVQLQNQAVELEAEKHKELELTKKELIHDTNPQLAQAHDRIANLERLAAMHSQTREASMAELDKTSKKLEHVQFHLDRTEREFEELRELRQTESVQLTQVTKARRELQAAVCAPESKLRTGLEPTSPCLAAAAPARPLPLTPILVAVAQNEALVQEVDERTGAGQRAHRVIEELSGSVKALEGSLREAAAAAERASMMQAEDAKRALEALAERMRDEVTRAAKGERESAQEQQQRFLDELRQQQRQHVNELSAQRQVQLAMEAQVESANSKLAQAVQAAKQSESDLEALRSAMGSDGEVVMRARAEVTAAKEDAEALRAQLARVSGMASVLQSKVPTLEAQVRELAASGDELRATLVKQAREAELSQREAVEATLAPWTERCMLAEERLKAKEAEVTHCSRLSDLYSPSPSPPTWTPTLAPTLTLTQVPPLQQRLDEAMQAAASHLSEKRSLAEQVRTRALAVTRHSRRRRRRHRPRRRAVACPCPCPSWRPCRDACQCPTALPLIAGRAPIHRSRS